MAIAPMLFTLLCNRQRDLAHVKPAFLAALSSSSSFCSSSLLLLHRLFLRAVSPFPQCLANTTTKMVDAMEEYEKEAGCVPILHPEVKPVINRTSATHANNRKMRERRWRVYNGAVLQLVYGNSDAPCKTTGGGEGGVGKLAMLK